MTLQYKVNRGFDCINILLLGTCGSGKSCIVNRYIFDTFVSEYDPTIEDIYRKRVIYNRKIYDLQIFDPSGQELYGYSWKNCVKNADVIVVVCENGMEEQYTSEIEDKEKIVYCKSKCEVVSGTETTGTETTGTETTGTEVISVSAMTGKNIVHLFETAIKTAIELKEKKGNTTVHVHSTWCC